MSDFERSVAQVSGQLLLVMEACASVALSHPEGCSCQVCAAAHGDINALWTVAEAVQR